ncbi:MAG: LTA synthase family protein, partial [Candidatus Binatia bacterium]
MRIPARFTVKCLQLVAANFAIFVVYRLLFLAAFADPQARVEALPVLLRGMRLDAALFGSEIVLLIVLSVATRQFRYRAVLGGLWFVTGFNLFGAVANLLFFHERNQHLWENLLANAGEPREALLAIEPFFHLHPTLPAWVLLVYVAGVVVARRHGLVLAGHRLDLWRSPRALVNLGAVVLLLVAVNLEPIADQKKGWFGHLRLGATASKHYAQFDDYMLNQAVVNPVFDLLRYVPDALGTARHHYRLDGPQALRETESLLGLSPVDPHYPLLRTVRGEGGLGIRNVILLQVEGLGTNVLERQMSDGYLTPYLHQLSEQGLYFPNVYQSFCATDGSTFSIATSLHRTYAVSEGVSRFFPHEVNGHYGTLSNVLGASGYRHYFMAGFRQRIADFRSFMGNQGYDALGFDEIAARLGDRAEEQSNTLGVFDGPFLQEAADILVATPGAFTAHIATSTSHSPWQVPPGTTAPFEGPPRSFRYADDSIRAFVERLRRELPDFDHTLFVLVGDHTSITFSDSLVERIRVPLIVYSTTLTAKRERWTGSLEGPASHVDILPTILTLLDGEYRYGGMGSSLLEPRAGRAGLISSNYNNSLYITDDFALRYTPRRKRETDVLAFTDGELV